MKVANFLPAAIGLLGVITGAMLTGWLAERRWRMDLRLEAYLELVDAARTFLWAGAEVGRDDDRDMHVQRDAVRDQMAAVRHAVTRVSLVGPAAAANAAKELRNYYADVLYDWFRARQEPHGDTPPPAEVQEGRRLMDNFQDIAVETIGVADKP